MRVWCVFARWHHEDQLLYIFKLKRDATDTAETEQENYLVSGGYVPKIVVESWEVE